MDKEAIRKYIKDNLKLGWIHDGESYYIVLKLEGEIVSKLRFEGY